MLRTVMRPVKAKGVQEAELNMPWTTLEPSRGTFNFSEFDQELANAAAAGIKIVPIFWQSGWRGSPATWETNHEVTNTGVTGIGLAWWDQTEQSDYFTYVTTIIAHANHNPGFGGAFMDYGRLDDSPGNAYLTGPTVTGSDTGSWQTATVTLTNAQFNELQNLNADLRPAVTDPTQPLYVSSVTMSTTGS